MANSLQMKTVDMKEDRQDKDNAEYGSCEGPDAKYIKLISSDDHEFIIKKEYAMLADTIKAMLSGPGQFSKNETNVIHLKEIPSHILQKVCLYLTYKARYINSGIVAPEFIIQPEIAVELLLAATFLDC